MRYFSKAMMVASAALCLNLSAYAQDISLKINNVTVKEAIELLKKNTGYSFVFSSSDLNTKQRVSVSAENATIQEVVAQILKGQQGLDYEIQGKKIVIKRATATSSSSVSQEKKQISGNVVDTAGIPVIGATIKEKGTNNGTITDFDGNFSLNVAEGAQLEISYIGFKPQELNAVYGKNLAVVLKEDTEVLDEVVVIGYGTQKKVNLTGAVSSVNFNDKTLSRPITTISSALAGMSAGLNVMQTSAKPDSENSNISIRGIGTLNDSAPLILIDGMEIGINEINPNDISSISILKDAASCAIYGNRAANGVILVTTKQGIDGKVNVTYSGKFSYNTPAKLIERISNYADYMEIMNETALNSGQSAIFNNSTIEKWREAENDPNGISESGYPNYVAYPNTDWYAEVFKPKWMQEHSISVSGSEKKTNYNISATYLDNPGLVVNSGLKKFYIRSNIEVKPTSFLKVGLKAWGFHSDQERNNVDDLFGFNMYKTTPGTYPFYKGYYGASEATEEDPQTWNPVHTLSTSMGGFKKTKIYVNPYIKLDFLKYFTLSTNFFYDKYDENHVWTNGDYLPLFSFRKNELRNNPPSSDSLKEYGVAYYQLQNQSWKATTILQYDQSIKKHDISFLLGYEESRKWGNMLDVKKKGMIDPSLIDFDALTKPEYINGNSNENYSSRSLFGRVNYSYNSKYLFEANIRNDASSRFAPKNRWGLFPSFSIAWRLSEENLIKRLKIFDNLKVRASWGKLGNNSIGNFEWRSLYNSSVYSYGGNETLGLIKTSFSNGKLKWENTTVTNIGTDFAVLNGRFNGTIDFYSKYTNGILYKPTLIPTLAFFDSPRQNIAEVSNKGVELTLSWQERVKDFTYSISGNFSFNKNIVEKYKGKLIREWRKGVDGNNYYYTNLGDVSTGGNERVIEGHVINEYYMLNLYSGNGAHFNNDGSVNPLGGPKDGMIRTTDDMKWLKAMFDAGYEFYPKQGIGKDKIWYGDIIYADKNGDGIYGNEEDKDFQGYSKIPKYYFGFQTFLGWKGIDFSMNWSGAAGFKIDWYDVSMNSSIAIFGYNMGKELAYDHYYFDPDNPEASNTNIHSKNPRMVLDQNGQVSAIGAHRLQNGNYIKLKNLTIGYTLPKFIIEKIYAQNVRIYTSVENLFTVTKFKGLDPEMMSGNGYAPMRQLALGINVTF